MSDAPKRIWIDGSEWFDEPPLAGDNQPEYIREDLHTADIRAARREAYAQAMEDAAGACDAVAKNYDVMKEDRKTYEPQRVQRAAKSMVRIASEDIRALPNPYEDDT